MSTDKPAPETDSRGVDRPVSRRFDRTVVERSYLSLVPWRNLRRALFLIIALLGIIALKRSGGGAFRGVLESVAPPPRSPRPAPPAGAPRAPETTVHLQAWSPPR